MEAKVEITLKGLPDEEAYAIGHAIESALVAFRQSNEALDLRRMHQLIVTTDFAAELAALSSKIASGKPIDFTSESYAVAVAKVLLLPRNGEYEILPVFSANMLRPLTRKNGEEEDFQMAIHLLHHELCHVHDDNKKLDALKNVMLKHVYSGKDIFIRPLAEVCWSEYHANFMSSSSVGTRMLDDMVQSFAAAIRDTRPLIDAEIFTYRFHADLTHLMSVFQRHGEFLPKSAAYVLGYMEGLGKSLSEISKDADDALSGSYFAPTWDAMHKALIAMRRDYPSNWKDLGIYDELAGVMEDYYASMGLVLSTTADGNAYVTIP